jgi:hypothetical protein
MGSFLKTIGNVTITATLAAAFYAWFQSQYEWTPYLVVSSIAGLALLNIGKRMHG